MVVTLTGGRLVDATGERADSPLSFADSRIVGDALPADSTSIDVGGLIVAPGFVDVHTHGGGMHDLHTENPADIAAYAHWAPSTGTTSFLAGVVGVPGGLPRAQMRSVIAAIESNEPGAEVLGIHLEGPYISVARRGAHDPVWLRTPTESETEELLHVAQGYLKLITVAPELLGAEALMQRLRAAGVVISIGHTDVNYEQAQAALKLGITHATHCFNAMRPLLHREPGPLGAIVEADEVRGELIADGVHVHPAAARVLVRALGPQRTVLVTDALACAGMGNIRFSFGGQPAEVVAGVARLQDGTITGSVLTMAQALRNVLRFTDLPLASAIGMATINPARSASVAARKGLLQPGYDADLLLLDHELALQATICRGRLAYATEEWQARLSVLSNP
ncbi:MAG: N-acetylglucosamine-6-phosphate deacetylase [Chloroflexota bacterium]|nr:N-acetylglucosamine-6-phosphate deacetylase [Chloroflexota bacterium]